MTFAPYLFAFVCVVFLISLANLFFSSAKFMSITQEGIRLQSRLGERFLRWDEIKTIAKGSEIGRRTFIAIRPRKFLSLPASFVVHLGDREAADRIASDIRAHMPVKEAMDTRSFFSR